MKKLINRAFLWIGAALLLAACTKEKEQITVSLDADAAFSSNAATLTLSLSKASSADVSVLLAEGTSVSGGTILPAGHLTFPKSVTVEAGSDRVSVDVTVNPEGLAAGSTYQAVIAIQNATGAEVAAGKDRVQIAYTVSGTEPGPTPGTGGETEGWSVTYEGFVPFTYQNGSGEMVTEDSEVFTVSGTGSEYWYITVMEGGFHAEYIAGQTDITALVQEIIEDEIALYAQYGYSVRATDLILNLETQIGYEEFEDGDYEVFIFGTDAAATPNGKYAWSAFTKTGSNAGGSDDDPVLEGPLTFQSDWTAAYYGTQVNQGVTYYIFTVSGVTDDYFLFDLWDGEIPASDLEAELLESAAYNIANYDYVLEGPEDYDAWSGVEDGTYHIYIYGLTEDNNLTGNYGHSVVSVSTKASYRRVPDMRHRLSSLSRSNRRMVKIPVRK